MSGEPLETADSRPEAITRAAMWARVLVKMGKAKSHGITVRRIPGTSGWGVYVEKHKARSTRQ